MFPRQRQRVLRLLLSVVMLAGPSCRHVAEIPVPPAEGPRELQKAVLPDYVIEPPDLLTIEAVQIVPKSPYFLRTLDVLQINVEGTLPDAPIAGQYPVQLGGVIDLGSVYGTVKVAELSLEEARDAIDRKLRESLRNPQVAVSLADIAGRQQIAGEHLVGPDGKVTLGTYGKVSVVGLTIPEAKKAIEQHLSEFLDSPEVAVDIFGYNSKFYYVITQGASVGDGVYRFPNTGNETVLDAISQINGLAADSSLNIWVARPTPDGDGCHQVMPVDWCGVTRLGDTVTNYQILPGDRVYIASHKWVKIDTELAKFLAPFERIFGFTLLGVGTVTRLSGNVLQGGGNPGFGGGGF